MADTVSLGNLHHMALTVSDVARSSAFYRNVLGFNVIAELSPARHLLGNGTTILAITLPSDQTSPVPDNDRFNENRIGLDHVSFAVDSPAALEEAIRIFDASNVPHGEIRDLSAAGLPVLVLAFRDPDNIQLELTAPKA